MNNFAIKSTQIQWSQYTLDFFLVIDSINKYENLESIIEQVGISIKPKGIFAFVYERTNKNNRENLKVFPIKDGVIQKHLINSKFYIQHELDYLMPSNKENHLVLIVAQKK